MDKPGVEDSAEDVDRVGDDEDEDGRRVKRRVNPEVETPAVAEDHQQPAASEEPAAPAPEAHKAPRPPRVRPLPKLVESTRAQRELRELTHYPFEAWCRHCARCKFQSAQVTPLVCSTGASAGDQL